MIGIYRHFVFEQPSMVLFSAQMQAKASFSTVAQLRCVGVNFTLASNWFVELVPHILG